jgi:hypothetical protein
MPKNKPATAENPAAALARKRWAKTTPEQRSQTARDLNRARWGQPRKTRRNKKKST